VGKRRRDPENQASEQTVPLGADIRGNRREGTAMIDSIRTRFTDEAGQALIEYALIVSLIAVISIAALTLTGHSISGILGNISDAV
jgi:Flp pilus assembly pilin Flp